MSGSTGSSGKMDSIQDYVAAVTSALKTGSSLEPVESCTANLTRKPLTDSSSSNWTGAVKALEGGFEPFNGYHSRYFSRHTSSAVAESAGSAAMQSRG